MTKFATVSTILIRTRRTPWRGIVISSLWLEHGLPVLLYAVLSVALTWPMLATFTTWIPGNSYDAYNGLWVVWHVKEALLGRQPLFDLPLLYYPEGATLLTHVPGPVTGLFALPFWPWGAEAAHNGAVLVSFLLTGYFMYLLARTLGQERPVAFFAGLVLLVAPMHLAGLLGHTTKVFLGALPLLLLCLHQTLNLAMRERRAAWWAAATALALLFTLLHHSLQFIMAALAIAFFALVALLRVAPSERRRLLRRLGWLALVSAVVVGPLLWATARAAYDPAISFDRNHESFRFQPDLVEFFLPPMHSRLWGQATADFVHARGIAPTIETTVSLSWVALALIVVAVARRDRRARLWLGFTLVWVVLSLGPSLRVLGRTHFTEYGLPLLLPYAFLTQLPGLDFLRTPGRFMQIGFVGVGVTAGWGLMWLRQRFPQWATAITAGAILLLLVEAWPEPWPQMQLRPAPAFYQQLADDEETYGVLDLPVTPDDAIPAIMYNAHYQMYQMVHRKGIAMGYVSRTYGSHPLFPCLYDTGQEAPDVIVNGEPSPCAFHALYDLPRHRYRYVVWHKPQPWYDDYRPGTMGELVAADFVARYFPEQEPLVDDELAAVYALPLEADPSYLPTTLMLDQNWYGREQEGELSWRWARSPATLVVTSPREQSVSLEIAVHSLYAPSSSGRVSDRGRLWVEMDNGDRVAVLIERDQLTTVPLTLTPGQHTITLTLEAGNFRPAADGQGDPRLLSFAIRTLNLQTTELGER
ncbi:MAG: hypothetical protein M3220_23040 [Chloroflexota bacterium]|nr:hypothetical protein [Chloroflexota bacterium]